MEGYLEIKQGILARYQTKYFRLNGPTLLFGPDKNQITNRIHLGIAQLISSPDHPNKFIIHTGMQMITLRAKTVQQRFIWFRTLKRVQKNLEQAEYCQQNVEELKSNNMRKLEKLNEELWQNQADLQNAIEQISINIAKPSKMKSLTQKLKTQSLILKKNNFQALRLLEENIKELKSKEKENQRKKVSSEGGTLSKKSSSSSSKSSSSLSSQSAKAFKEANRNTARFNQLTENIFEYAGAASLAPGIREEEDENMEPFYKTNMAEATLEQTKQLQKQVSTGTENAYHSVNNDSNQQFFNQERHSIGLKEKYMKSNAATKQYFETLNHEQGRYQLAEKFTPEQKFPLLSVIKDSGAEMSYPVSVNQPISFLQRMCEHMYYSNLLEQANIETDQATRMVYIAAFLVSQYSISELRTKKPFNPLLGETFEYIDKERNFEFLSEQISHRPAVSAIHCQSKDFTYLDNWKYSTHFAGNSIKLVPESLGRIILNRMREEYVFNKCTTVLSNVMVGKVGVENIGEMTIECKNMNTRAVLKFKQDSFFGKKEKNLVEGQVFLNGKLVYYLRGEWNKNLQVRGMKEKNRQITLWEKRHVPNPEYYNFNHYTLQMNHLNNFRYETLPPTDSRFRPDIRALEYRQIDTAIQEKKRLQEKQRIREQKMFEEGKNYLSNWFTKVVTEDGMELYVSNDKYWKERRKGSWEGCSDIF